MRKPVPILAALRLGTKDKLLNKLEKRGDCLCFTGHKNKAGYGFVSVMIKGKRYPILAHRLAWALENGKEPPENRIICHRCNNPSCCNNKHLYLGTPKTNAADKVAAGTQSRTLLGVTGVAHPRSRYTQEQRNLAIEMRRNAIAFKEIAKAIGCTRETVERWWSEALR